MKALNRYTPKDVFNGSSGTQMHKKALNHVRLLWGSFDASSFVMVRLSGC